MKVFAITVEPGEEKPTIWESLCNGCGICVRKCPFDAISIINLPQELEEECVHRYAKNAFKLFRLPTPSTGKVTGIIGKNGAGKTTALKILSGEVVPNLGDYSAPAIWDNVIQHFRGSTLYDYFSNLREKQLRVVHKPQYIDQLASVIKGTVGDVLEKIDERGKARQVSEHLDLRGLWEREISVLSGGEGQRLAIASAICRDADIYIFDEPSSYLDIRQRLHAAIAIRSLLDDGKTVLTAEHDIAMLDYLSDQVCLIYGEPAVYGVVSHPRVVRTGINIYLQGYLPDDNMRFRDEPIQFHSRPAPSSWQSSQILFQWNSLEKSYEGFKLTVQPGYINRGEVVGALGSNGIGKTTFVKLIAGLETPSKGELENLKPSEVMHKPQYISRQYPGTVANLLRDVAGSAFETSFYKSEIISPLRLEKLLERGVPDLSGGELQKITIAACLSKPAQIYLIDEPSAFLDVEERLAVARMIRRTVEKAGAAAIVVEHDVSVLDFLADRLLPFLGTPGVEGQVQGPVTLRDGMNAVLEDLQVTFRRDLTTGRPRINKQDSRLDRHQKEIREYYYVPSTSDED